MKLTNLPIRAILAAYGNVWAIDKTAFAAALELYETNIEPEAKAPRLPRVEGSVAVLPLTGIITQRSGGGLMEMLFGGTKTDTFGKDFDHLMTASNVGAIVLDIDSPGGIVFGVQELADKILAARGTKPVIAVANSYAASAAYCIGSAASQFIVTPSGQVGSIGVYIAHTDVSEADAKAGIKTTLISAGKHKTEGNPFEPLTDEARADMQAEVDGYYDSFVGSVAKGRGVTAGKVKRDFGQGRTVMASEAVEAGMVDRVATLDEVVSELIRDRRGKDRRQRAQNTTRLFDAPADKTTE